MSRLLTEGEWAAELGKFEHTAFRLELQPQYREPVEDESVRRFLGGDPQDPAEWPDFRAWAEEVAAHVAAGKRMERVRVFEEPPTDYQRWLRWLGRWNTEAGERIRYVTRKRAYEVGLLPAAGTEDWWLLDSSRLVVMRFDDDGNRIENELISDPARVVQACAWRDLATHHSAPDDVQGHAA